MTMLLPAELRRTRRMFRPVPRVLRLLRQGTLVRCPRSGRDHAVAAGVPVPLPTPAFTPIGASASSEDSGASVALSVCARALSSSPPSFSPAPAEGETERPRLELVEISGPHVLRVSNSTIPRVLATKINGDMRPATGFGVEDPLIITAVGPQALFTSLRAVAIANEDRAREGKGPVVISDIRDMGARNAKAFVVTEPDPALSISHVTAVHVDSDNRFSIRQKQTNFGPVAAALKVAVMFSDAPILVTAVGSMATSQAVWITFLGTSWAKEHGVTSVVLPGRQLIEGAGRDGTTMAVNKMVIIRTSPKAEPMEDARRE
jgi:stage V sporulation protein SpoVS